MIMSEILEKYKGKTVLITGHTGFKGAWMCKILLMSGAKVVGYSLEPPTEPSLFQLLGLERQIVSVIGDIRDFDRVFETFDLYKPEIVFHLAAQPIVTISYEEPRMTYETNVMGTVNICECIRRHSCVKSFVNVTTDKVYKNNEWAWGYRESDTLNGHEPYSNSKSCSELVTHSYKNCYFDKSGIAVSTVRAGNVIGGGDFAYNRIIPDCVKAAKENSILKIRNPFSVRPYQHVLEPLMIYLKIAILQMEDKSNQGFYNVGPEVGDCISTVELVKKFGHYFGKEFNFEISGNTNDFYEARYLRLDTSLIREKIGYYPTWNIEEAIRKTVEWTKVWMKCDSEECVNAIVETQILEFESSIVS